MTIFIDSACDILYSFFYIKGLQECFGKKNIHFKNRPFSSFPFNNHYFAFIIKGEGDEKKVIIDYADSSIIDREALAWSDCYGKVNIDEKEPNDTEKLISIGPSFGIHIFSLAKTLFLSISNYLISWKRIVHVRRFFSNYKAQFYRPRINDYYPCCEKKNYVFFAGSLWKKELKTNSYRANFIKACLSDKSIDFEGGFAPRTNNDLQGYEEITMQSSVAMKEYVKKLKQSTVAFNTPAVRGCHGWKLAEFLCFGKSIISTPLYRKMPIDLENGKQFILTDGSYEDIKKKLASLMDNSELRNHLKENARAYYENVLAPSKVIQRILCLNNSKSNE